MVMPDEEMKEKLDKFLRDWVNAEKRGLTCKENVQVSQHGKEYHLLYALYTKGRYAWVGGRKRYFPPKLHGGITVEKYEEYKDYIEAKMHEIEIEDSWITQVLKSESVFVNQGHGLYSMRIRVPRDIWAKIKSHFFYVNKDWYEDMDEFTAGYWDTYYGWATREPEKVVEILREEAEKRATEEHRQAAGLVKEASAKKEIEIGL